ncbi:hypothetical protein OUZ56_026679 [Daphnia magna]|uniref:Uncharacterized protein n=1 Tax=Daphnia magna TaxID=35525 RepID=A0ABQ9ZNU4_9CRUS|nr:hypothetical protein OUZ56_026679 [Daphnia magna]
MKARSDILRTSDGAVEGGQNQKKNIHRTSKSDIGLSGGYQKDVLNIRPRHLSDIRRTALCYVGDKLYQAFVLHPISFVFVAGEHQQPASSFGYCHLPRSFTFIVDSYQLYRE